MTAKRFLVLGALLGGLTTSPLWSQVDLSRPTWTVPAARSAVARIDEAVALGPLFERARAGDDAGVLHRLREIAADDQLPVPARERILYDFASGLGDLPPYAVGEDVLQFLRSYRARTLVPHPDNELVGTPLFNIPAATAGSVNEWQRQAGYDAARAEFARGKGDPLAAFLADYRSSATSRRRGLLQALPLASTEQLRGLAGRAADDLASEPALTPVVARAALLAEDVDLLRTALVFGSGPELASLIREAAQALDEVDRAALLATLLSDAPPINASLAIAGLAPSLLHRPEVTDRLFDLLGDPALGGAAALALSASDRPALKNRLSRIASEGAGLPARRASTALSVVRQSTPGAVR